jgi:hypothetical protein
VAAFCLALSSPLFELARVLVRFDHVASRITAKIPRSSQLGIHRLFVFIQSAGEEFRSRSVFLSAAVAYTADSATSTNDCLARPKAKTQAGPIQFAARAW